MNNILKKWLLLVFICFLFFNSQAQNNFFKDVSEASIKKTTQKRVIIPSKYRTVQLNTAALLSFLKSLPSEQNINNRKTIPVFALPMPDGTTATFRIWESSTMAPELAAANPGIKTFTGQGIDDPTATIKLDWTSFGFHAMILSPLNGAVFIDPFDQITTTNYQSYYKKDFEKTGTYLESDPKKMLQNARPANTLAGTCVGPTLRTYRLAVACTHQYAIKVTAPNPPTKTDVLAKIVTSVNRVNGVYETELAIRMVIVANNTDVVFISAATDPFTGNNDGNILIDESQQKIDSAIGNANYDIGHTFSTGGGGIAGLGVVCITGAKASGVTGLFNPVGDAYDIDYVAHEMGHQFGADHPFNSLQGACNGNGVIGFNAEPGSGSTIMAYAGICSPENLQNHSDPQFHAVSFDQITNYAISSSGNNCAVKSSTGNAAPVVNAGPSYTIPISTPFVLTGSATDANGDAITYSWEQVDVGGPFGIWDSPSGNAPLFRSFPPTTSATRYFPKLSTQIANSSVIGEVLPAYGRNMNFRLTARDNKAGGGGVCYAQTAVTASASSGPFVLTSPNSLGIIWYVNGLKTVTWNPAGTEGAPVNCSNVNIELSIDGGLTFPIILKANTANDGSESVQVPNNISSTARVRVMAVGNVFYDFSNNNFSIQASNSYTFTGNGNWSNPANWSGNIIPPTPLPASGIIIINHIAGGNCILNVSQQISVGATLNILTGKNLLVPGTLTIQ